MQEQKQKSTILSWIETFFISVAIFIIFFLALSAFLPRFQYSLIVIRSGSMEPTIKTGSVLISKKQATYHEGDVITFAKIGGEIITHRITESLADGSSFRTKGDDNNAEDMFLAKKESILGKALFAAPYFGYLISFSKTKLGILIIFVIPATYLIIEEIIKIKREFKNKKETEEQTI
ncbi:signal peptidase I [Patescibacteria group bacterium]